MRNIHIQIEGVDGARITCSENASEETIQALTDMAKLAYEKYKLTPKQLEQRNCKHDWKSTHSGYCADCKKCGKKI